MKMRSFQLSVDEDGGSPSRIFGSPEAIFFFLVVVAVGLGLSFGDEMNILALGSESWKQCSGRYSGAGSSLDSRAAEHPNQAAPFC